MRKDLPMSAEARRLGVAMPRLEAAEPYFTNERAG
jgi:hypothetical protein